MSFFASCAVVLFVVMDMNARSRMLEMIFIFLFIVFNRLMLAKIRQSYENKKRKPYKPAFYLDFIDFCLIFRNVKPTLRRSK